jgi:transcriptional regulator with XRE-family HTH domain
MKISNYLPELADKNLYVELNDKLLSIIKSAYSDIKSTMGINKFSKISGLSKPTLTAIMRGEILPSLNFINKLAENVKWDLWNIVYENAEFIRGKTNSNTIKIPKTLTEDLAYLLGSFRDGSLVHYSYVYELEFGQKNSEWLEQVIIPKLKNVFGLEVKTKNRKNGSSVIRKRSKAVYAVLKSILSYENNYQLTPKIILNVPFELQRYYIAGFYDAEGRKNIKDMNFYQQWYKNCNCPSLDDIKNMLMKRNIKTRYYKIKPQNNAFLFTLHVEVETKKVFLKEIPLQHPTLKRLF